jgi:hypothetical protein
VQILAFNF